MAKSVILLRMQTLARLPDNAQNFHGGIVTIGNYDGLHLGHQSLLRKMSDFAGPKIVLTFDPHPLQVLHPERQLKRVFPREDLAERLPDFNIDLLLVLPFDREFSRLTALEFLDAYVGVFNPRHIVAGYDFAFGSGREGTLEVLKAWAAPKELVVDVVAPLRIGGEIVSSRRIRDLVQRGDMNSANLLLGRPYYLRGEVIRGAGRGRTIGVPTLNQKVINETLPLLGVYASRTRSNGRNYASITNIGTNPTFEDGRQVKVETNVFNLNEDWLGRTVDVELVERLRDERKFESVDELKKQIESDIAKAKAIVGAQ